MVDEPDAPAPFSLRRWSQRKLDVARKESSPAVPPASPASAAAPPATAAATSSPAQPAEQSPPLPPVESLSFDSDFGPFMQPKVAEDVKRAALKKLFSDPQFNVMDGLDIYIGDYTQPDPMPAGMLDKLGKVYGMLAKDDAPAASDGASHASAGDGESTSPVVPSAADAPATSTTAAAPTQAADGAPLTDGAMTLPATTPSATAAPALRLPEGASASANAAPATPVAPVVPTRPSE